MSAPIPTRNVPGIRWTGGLLMAAIALVMSACTGGASGDLSTSATVQEPSSTTATTEPTTTTAPTTTAPTTAEPATTTTEPTTTTTIDPAIEILGTLTLEQKVGQLLMPIVGGTTADGAGAGDLVASQHVGGVIYLGNNITDAAQLAALSDALQQRAMADTGIPLLISVDQEGGRVVRIRDQVLVQPSARSFEGDTEAARAGAMQSGNDMQLQGINMVLAPVADVTDSTTNVIGNRAYSGDPLVASEMVAAVIGGYDEAGLATVVKHWPGHGSTEVDSHRSLPTLSLSLEAWNAVDRLPFVAALEADVDAVMLGHLAFPALDPTGDPATYSAPMVAGALRAELGFEGVVMTDALDMGAVNDLSSGELAVRSISAGVDILLAPLDPAEASSALLAAVADGTLSEERIDASVLRILRLKIDLGLLIAPIATVEETETEDAAQS